MVTASEAEEDEGLLQYSKFVFPEAVNNLIMPLPYEPQPPSPSPSASNSGLKRRVTVMLKRLGSKRMERRGSF